MPSLVTLAAIRTRFNLADDDTVNSLLTQSLNSASLLLELWLDTSFASATGVKEQFLIPRRPTSVDLDYPTLRLNHGLLTGVTSVKAAGIRRELDSSDPIDQAEFVESDLDRGLVTVDMLFPENTFTVIGARLRATSTEWFFQVEYDKGFTTSTVPGQGDVYQSVPVWLQEAAHNTGKLVFDQGGSCGAEELEDTGKGSVIRTLLMKKVRNVPYGLRPIWPLSS